MLFTVVARGVTERPQLVLEVRDESGHNVFRTLTPLEDLETGSRLALEIPRLALLGGDYDLVVSAQERSDPDPGIDRLASFSVADEPGAEGVADLRGSWRVADRERVAS